MTIDGQSVRPYRILDHDHDVGCGWSFPAGPQAEYGQEGKSEDGRPSGRPWVASSALPHTCLLSRGFGCRLASVFSLGILSQMKRNDHFLARKVSPFRVRA